MNSSSPHEQPAPLSPPRFSIGSLLFWMTVLCAWLASFSLLGAPGAFALGLLVLAIVAHVAGNAIGVRLRDHGPADRSSGEASLPVGKAGPPPRERIATQQFAPATRLRQRDSLGKPIFFITALGALGCAIGGGYGLAQLLGDSATFANVGLGVFACGVLGAIWSFVAGSFLQVTASALWQASREK